MFLLACWWFSESTDELARSVGSLLRSVIGFASPFLLPLAEILVPLFILGLPSFGVMAYMRSERSEAIALELGITPQAQARRILASVLFFIGGWMFLVGFPLLTDDGKMGLKHEDYVYYGVNLALCTVALLALTALTLYEARKRLGSLRKLFG
jgi:hypothetical protein